MNKDMSYGKQAITDGINLSENEPSKWLSKTETILTQITTLTQQVVFVSLCTCSYIEICIWQ